MQLALAIGLLVLATEAHPGPDRSEKSADEFPSEVASVWFDALYDVIRSQATSPPAASRIYGVAAIALYEAIAPGAQHGRSLVGQLNDLSSVPRPKRNKTHHWPAVANAALARTIRGVFPTLQPDNLSAVKVLEANFGARFRADVPRRDYDRSVAQGQAVADAILAWAATDGFSTLNNCLYIPASVPGAWEPTPPGFSNPLQPCWGQIRPMALTSGEDCAPRPHPRFDTGPGSKFFAAAREVYDIGRSLTDEQTVIATYWADGPGATGTPPGHWIAIVGQIARNDALSLAAAAEAYARVGIAVTDAFIQCWSVKYAFNLQRPETYIQDNIDAAWSPFLVTPPFPSYTSGHSTQSGAVATVLTDMFGVKAFTDTLHTDHGLVPSQIPRSFHSFAEAAAEAAVSRLYGGIHYAFDNDAGLSAGRCIGRAILKRLQFRQ